MKSVMKPLNEITKHDIAQMSHNELKQLREKLREEVPQGEGGMWHGRNEQIGDGLHFLAHVDSQMRQLLIRKKATRKEVIDLLHGWLKKRKDNEESNRTS